MPAKQPIKRYNSTTTIWEGIASGSISDGTNEISPTEIGLLSSLTTTSKTSIVSAINEVQQIPTNTMSRQAIINGNFDIWQRGTSFTGNGIYLSDRWKHDRSAITGTTLTFSQQSLTTGDISGASNFLRLNSTAVGSGYDSTSVSRIVQKIENGTRLLCGAGKKVSVSFWARSSISGKRIGVEIDQNYGSGGSAAESINGQNFTLTSSWTKYTFTFTTNTLVGKTFGSNNDDGIALQFWHVWGSSYQSLFGSSTSENYGIGNIDIAQVQVCSGDVALPFQPQSIADELSVCQRYYEAVGVGLVGRVFSSTRADFAGTFKVQKRVSPTLTLLSTTPTLLEIGVANRTGTASTLNSNFAATTKGFGIYIDGFSSMTSPNMVHMTSDSIAADAEL